MLRKGLFLLLLLGWWGSASGHSLRPAIVTISLLDSGQYQVQIDANLEAMVAGIGPQHKDTNDSPRAARYNALRALPPAELEAEYRRFLSTDDQPLGLSFDGELSLPVLVSARVPAVGDLELARKSTLLFEGAIPRGVTAFVWAYPESFGDNALRIRYGDDEVVRSHWLKAGQASPEFLLDQRVVPRPRMEVMQDYTVLGFTHILPLGLDHILFVVGIFLLSLQLKPLLWQVTAFTLAHTITLGMSIYGLISVSPAIVEPLIAASIVYVGVENILTSQLHRWRIVIVFLFGLLHGMGFAGVLTEIGLPRSEFLTALITFNVGVELGQLAVIALAFAAVGLFRNRTWYRSGIVIPGSALISVVGAYWMVERVI